MMVGQLRFCLNSNPVPTKPTLFLKYTVIAVPIHFLQPGQTGRIDQLLGSRDDVHRLHELGFRSGASVEMVQSGATCIVKLCGSKFCLRAGECLGVLVQVQPGEAA